MICIVIFFLFFFFFLFVCFVFCCCFFFFFFSNLCATPTPAMMVRHDRVQYREKERKEEVIHYLIKETETGQWSSLFKCLLGHFPDFLGLSFNISFDESERPTSICCNLWNRVGCVLWAEVKVGGGGWRGLGLQKYNKDLLNFNDQNKQVDTVILDFSKAFDTVPHRKLLHKLGAYGIRGPILNWINSFPAS